MRVRTRPAVVALFLAASAAAAVGSCSRERGDRALDAAVVPGADLSAVLDYSAALDTPVLKKARKDPAGKRGYASAAGEESFRGLEEAMGIGREDLARVRVTADLDTFEPSAWRGRDGFERLDAVAVLAFDRPLTTEKLEAGARYLARLRTPASTVSRTVIDSRQIVTVDPPLSTYPALYAALSGDGKAVYLTLNAASIGKALRREEGETVGLSEPLAQAERSFAEGAQLRTVLVVPATVRDRIRQKIAEAEEKALENPALGMFLGVLSPYRDLATVALAARLGEGIEIVLSADLGDEGQALQASALLQTMIIPLFKARLARETGTRISDLDGKVLLESQGAVLSLTVRLDTADLEALGG